MAPVRLRSVAQDAHGARPPGPVLAPLYAAGFTTAFGAHAIAAGLGAESGDLGVGLLAFGLLLAVYDLAEVVLKPVFGTLSDRIGVKPVIVGGLVVFALASFAGVFAGNALLLGAARLGQGAAASAFSPASSAAVARLAGPATVGRYFGRYGSYKGLGYALGPLIGAALIGVGGFPLLFGALTAVAAITAGWAMLAVPRLPVLPRPRYTLADLVRQTTHRSFLVPTLALAAATGALGVAVGFLPLLATSLQLPLLASMAAVTVLAVASTVTQPIVGRLRDSGRVTTRAGVAGGLGLIALGVALLAAVPVTAVVYLTAAIIGLGIGTVTPLGFAHLAATTPPERLGRTMGSAELGREVGDAGGPLLVGGIAAAVGVGLGLGALALVIAVVAVLALVLLQRAQSGSELQARRSSTGTG
ncbi:MFS transporter [Cryobacterium tepidiphilum]|uniref:MFS transporter n=1 Tax=Cryobacterium tepidiphilum TaxID=2486026 RepID=A0A3M8LET8_9MICO|nr:MFS transporter [Cryobacterium tepidiphilum]